MKDKTIDVEFTVQVKGFLEARGYTHIISLGIEPTEQNDANEPETGKENYWLEAVKEDDPRIGYHEADHIIQEINDENITAMAPGDDTVQYMIKVPVEDYNDFLKDR